MTKKLLVSVVTPSFNAARFIERTIKSVQEQDYPFVEHVVVDGGSSDETPQILRQFPHLVWTSEPDRGQSDALNKGFKRARGDIIGWLNADDVYQPRAVSRAIKLLQNNPDADFVYGDCIELDEDDSFIRLIKGYPVKGYQDFIFRQPIPQPSIFFRRGVLKKLRGVDEDLHYVMDWEFWLRASFDFRFIYLSGEALAGFRKYDGSKSYTSPRRFNEEWKLVLKRWSKNMQSPNDILFKQGIRYQQTLLHITDALRSARQKERFKALKKLLDAIQESPSPHMLKTFIYLFFVIIAGGENQTMPKHKRPINVLYIQAGKGVGGAKISLLHLIKSLGNRKVKIYLALSYPVDDIFMDMIDRQVVSIQTFYLPIWYKTSSIHFFNRLLIVLSKVRHGWYVIPALQISYFIMKNKIDLVHSNNSASPVGAIAAWLTRRPHVWHIRESIGTRTDFSLVLGDNLSVHFMRSLSRAIICISEYTAKIFVQRGVKPIIILNGIDTHEFELAAERGSVLRNKLLLGSNLAIGMVGNLRASLKEHELFLQAMSLVLKKISGIRFVVFGGTSDLDITEYTRSLQKSAHLLNLDDYLIWAEHTSDIPAMMNCFDILVHPVSKEGSGRVIMEAMAAGKPIVAIQAGGVQELIQHDQTGVLVEPQNPSALAEAVIALLNDQVTMQKMGERAKLYANDHFSHERTSLQTFQLYQRILVESGKWKNLNY